MLRWFFGGCSALLILLWSTTSVADGFDWGGQAATRTAHIGPLDRGLVTIEVTTQEGPSDFEYETLVRAAWRGGAREDGDWQVLYEGFGAAHASEFNVSLEGEELVLRYPIGDRYDAGTFVAEERWRWQGEAGRFAARRLAVPGPIEQAVAGVVSLLELNRLVEARDALDHMVRSARGGLLVQSDTIFFHFLVATHRLAAATANAGSAQEAGALLMSLFMTPPVTSARLRPDEDGYVICAGTARPCRGAFNDLAATTQTTRLLEDCGRLLVTAGHVDIAADVLSQVVTFEPDRSGAHLHLADALWALDLVERSQAHYRRHLALRSAEDGPLPFRVIQRALSR